MVMDNANAACEKITGRFSFWSIMSATRDLLEALIEAIDEGDEFDVVVIARDHDDQSLSLIANVWGSARDELIGHAVAMTRGREH